MWVIRYRTVDGCVQWFRIWLETYIAPLVPGMPTIGACAKIAVLTAPFAVASVPVLRSIPTAVATGSNYDGRRNSGGVDAVGDNGSGAGGAVRRSPVVVVHGPQQVAQQPPVGREGLFAPPRLTAPPDTMLGPPLVVENDNRASRISEPNAFVLLLTLLFIAIVFKRRGTHDN